LLFLFRESANAVYSDKKISGSILGLMPYHEKSSLISIGFIPNLLVVAEAKAGFLQLAVLLVA
jgi:hypothetical protein